ncbi:DDE-type integrase/transposase/recombinase [Ruegeria atlantica]
MDETHLRVCGKWHYLFWAIERHGHLIDFRWMCRNP